MRAGLFRMTDDAGTGMGNTDSVAIVIGGESSY
jgi:hypothetical protein